MALTLNEAAMAFAEQLIQQGRVDREGDWGSNQPTPQTEDAFLKDSNNNFEKYGRWFLGINTDANPQTKERYEFPFGDFKKIYKSGIVAIEQRAAQYGHEEIRAGAKRLLDIIG